MYPTPELWGLMVEFFWGQRAGKVQRKRADTDNQVLTAGVVDGGEFWTQVGSSCRDKLKIF